MSTWTRALRTPRLAALTTALVVHDGVAPCMLCRMGLWEMSGQTAAVDTVLRQCADLVAGMD